MAPHIHGLLINAGFGRPRGDTKNKSDLSPENFLVFLVYLPDLSLVKNKSLCKRPNAYPGIA